MPRFGTQSTDNLNECHDDLQRLFREVVKVFDCKVIWGFRDKEAQNQAFHRGASGKRWPDSWHNSKPSLACDVLPYPVDYKDIARFYYFGGYVKRLAIEMKISVTWGGDWDSDWEVRDQSFNDLGHWQLDFK